ncbi:MAG: type II toxin-antitoxin system VapC family toxin [Terracidiphilus sp.]|jgi:predicted nucleic acid-binding protein
MQVLFDSSVYIGAFRGNRDAGLIFERWRRKSPIWVSSVVLEELYAGADAAGMRLIEKLERDFERARRVLVPNLSDWTQTGRILAKVGAKYGVERIGQGRLTNDALIATSAARCGIEVITGNARDFARLAEFCPLQWRVG